MADRILLSAEHEVIPLLEQMELDRQKLIDILRVAAADRAQCTRNDVHGFELIIMNDKVVRGLRDAFCGPSWTLRVTPAMEAGIDTVVHDMDWIVGLIDAAAPKPNRPARYNQPKAIEGDDYLNKGVTVAMTDQRKPR